MKGVPASLNALASTSTVVDIRHPPGICCNGNLAQFDETAAMEGKARHWRHSHARVKTTCRVVEPIFFNRDRTMKLSNQVAIGTGAGRNIGEEQCEKMD